MHCNLSEDINKCPYFQKNTEECTNEHKCSFQRKEASGERDVHKREERWYEKYLK